MSSPNIRRALQLLPPCATTGIGSLPHTQLELGLQMALQVDVPFLPQLPAGNPSEYMIASALDGLPGMSFDQDGVVTVDINAWESQAEAYGNSIEVALQSDDLSAFEPSASACRAWRPFLWEVEHRKLALAKVQIAGPATVRWVARTADGRPVSEVAGVDRQIFRLLLARCIAMVKALRRTGVTPLLFLDEPGLYAFDRRDPRHLMVLQELKLMVLALRREGALVGLHCCSNTDWASVLGLGLDVLSLDVRLSLDAVLDETEAVSRFVASGATFSLGIVPTNTDASFALEELVDAVDVSLRAAVRPGSSPLLNHVLLTPACGLAMRSVIDAELVFDQLRQAQRSLRALTDPETVPAGSAPTLSA